ncbi:hypothetical protein BLNAU_16299 [Blattamonas nauphoetae]|uniref:Protein kinase domain-containing protein n=1 Tax=Blattamonas nauphoetae TaxID=2049346 RepID=A0ABQ9XBK6_9EUKA|nr:hypothetical protein BLNAU_16299 [Blattamonas nauphoetae]
MLVLDSKFERCEILSYYSPGAGAGMFLSTDSTLTIKRSLFVGCKASGAGGALSYDFGKEVDISDTLVKDCYSGTTGAVCIGCSSFSEHISFSHVFFVGNSIGDDSTFLTSDDKGEEATEPHFPDVAIHCDYSTVLPILQIEDCFSTVSPDSTGMLDGIYHSETDSYTIERIMDPEFNKIGPLLTAKPTVRMNEKTGKIELEIEGITPLTSQEYEVTVKDSTRTETKLRMLFSDGTGTLVSVIEGSLEYNTGYTILSIVGIVPEPSSSSSSRMTNDIEMPVAAWAFNLHATPSFITFSTPKAPPTIVSATCELVESDHQSAFVVLHFNKKVHGSFDTVVLEEVEDVTITVPIMAEALAGESGKFIIVGEDRLLTHDTTYTIKSIVPTPGTDSPFVFMNRTITFHIPKPSSDSKKSLSPETKALLSWLIPLVACLLVGLVLAIIIIVLLRRRQKKQGEPAQKEMESTSEFVSSHELPANLNESRDGLPCQTEKEWVEVMACNGGFEVSTAPMRNTLYSMLHKEKREIPKRKVGMEVVHGLTAVLAKRPESDVVTRLSSHWILVDPLGNVQLKLQMTSEEAELEAAQTKQQDGGLEGNGTVHNVPKDVEQAGMDGLRWHAPEVVAGGGSAVDGQKASVFSIGLVLWEIETGQVPFGELDAVHAQKLSATGVGPKMDTLKNESFIALIQQCVSANPKQRPSLSEIGEFLSSHSED